LICTIKDITYSLTQTNRKTLSIYVEPDGSVTVRAPRNLEIDKINSIVGLKRPWIYKGIAELKELNITKAYRSLANGEGYLYMGKSYRLKMEPDLKQPLSLSQGYFMLNANETEKAKEHFINFYKEKGRKHITERVNYFKKKLGVEPKSVRIMELGKRWASRGKTGINFHWKVMLAPISVIDYIIVHELAHLIREDHSPSFWEIVESAIPNYAERKNWLRLNGANLDI
jgi:predicted metal-dependent hydrolase